MIGYTTLRVAAHELASMAAGGGGNRSGGGGGADGRWLVEGTPRWLELRHPFGECDGLGCDLSAQVAACLSQVFTLCTLCTLSAPSAPSAPSLHPLPPLHPLHPFSGATVERSAAARRRGGGSGCLPARVRGAARAGGGARPQGGADAACGGVPRARAAAARGLGAGAAVRGRRRLRRELCWQGLRVRGLRGDTQGSLECIGLQPQIGDSLPPTPSPSPRLQYRPATCNRRPPPACPPSKPASPKPHVLAGPRAGL